MKIITLYSLLSTISFMAVTIPAISFAGNADCVVLNNGGGGATYYGSDGKPTNISHNDGKKLKESGTKECLKAQTVRVLIRPGLSTFSPITRPNVPFTLNQPQNSPIIKGLHFVPKDTR